MPRKNKIFIFIINTALQLALANTPAVFCLQTRRVNSISLLLQDPIYQSRTKTAEDDLV